MKTITDYLVEFLYDHVTAEYELCCARLAAGKALKLPSNKGKLPPMPEALHHMAPATNLSPLRRETDTRVSPVLVLKPGGASQLQPGMDTDV